MFSRNQWLLRRRRLLRQLKAQVRWRLGAESEDVIKYAQDLKQEFKGRWKKINEELLFSQLAKQTLILGGDFHAFSQCQRSHLRILRDVLKDKKIVLGLECFESVHQTYLMNYLDGELKEEPFLELIKWDTHWGFPWDHYRPLIQLAQERNYPVVALNRYFKGRSGRNLHLRDQHTARLLARTRKAYPDHLIYVLYGDLHLAESHLLKAMESERILNREKISRIFLDSERLYFREVNKGLVFDHSLIFKGKGNKYCWLTSSPWVKWQSYLIYLEQTYDRELDDDSGVDYTDHLAFLIQCLGRDLGVQLKAQDIAVYGTQDVGSFEKICEQIPKRMGPIVSQLIEKDRSFFIPQGGIFYLSRPSINHSSALAGSYIQARMSGRQRPPWQMPQDFMAAIWVESVSFFLSKLINPQRKSENLEAIRKELEAGDPFNRGRETLMIVLEQKMIEMIRIYKGRQRRPLFRPRKKIGYLDAARILGSMLGERLFQSLQKGEISLPEIKKMISEDVFASHFNDKYIDFIKRVSHPEDRNAHKLSLSRGEM